ncbi:DeoR family transcriptional regulator [Terrilactibacillus sp. BCM23-1]|uniref:DeoR family transcriptional regulator n=1 Tax=Terrilactibacillus tamarindi TaxID=2599694 RepID=A0A6N8CMN1_9BACI|nr:DeoR/GlpR family DNA-binding transcription regulator [Terrilactibacillus tamarindi]MTT31334.1 DeoR family transcriptional regulator [Terrilactibacillus tamarindi]
MLAEERHKIILNRLEAEHIVKLQDLVNDLHASESTVRRDLHELEVQRLLRRVHGGAALLQQRSEEQDMETKSSKNIQQKRIIAKMAAEQIKDNECLYIDAGSTTLEMIPYIHAKNVNVVTNGYAHVEALVKKNMATYLIGGMMKPNTRAFIGSVAIQALDTFRFDRAFIGVNGIDIDMGYTTPDPEEAMIKRRAQELALKSYILADSSKFTEVSFSKMFDLSKASIITNELPRAVKDMILKETTVIESN